MHRQCPDPDCSICKKTRFVWCEVRNLAHAWCAGKQNSPAAWQMSGSNRLSRLARHHSNILLICTNHCHLWMHENHASTAEPKCRNMFIRNQWGTSMTWSMQHLTKTWSATIASLIKRLINGEIVLMRVSKPKKHFEHLLWCVSLRCANVVTFKAYITAVMNKLTHVSFHKVE